MMNEQRLPIPGPAPDVVVEKLPCILRIQSITRLPFDAYHALNRAILFHEQASLTVEWLSGQVDVRLVVGALVSVRWQGRPSSVGGAIHIARLVLIERPEPAVNLFQTVPSIWVRERTLLRRASLLWQGLPQPFRHLFNAVFWDAHRFQRYLVGPSSISGHHDTRYGNFLHSIEVAERALMLAQAEPLVCPSVLVLAALLHDAGKADEYRLSGNRFELSDRGRLVGHRHTIIEWIAAARAKHRIIIEEAHYLGLLHALTCARGAPAWLGIREPQSLDATLLSIADRLSGQIDLMERHAPPGTGFGRYHAHLGGRPFVVQSAV